MFLVLLSIMYDTLQQQDTLGQCSIRFDIGIDFDHAHENWISQRDMDFR